MTMITLTQLDCTLTAKGLTAAQFTKYQTYGHALVMPSGQHEKDLKVDQHFGTVGLSMSVSMRMYGRCLMDDLMQRALRDLLFNVPDVRVELWRGAPDIGTQVKEFRSRLHSEWPLVQMLLAGDHYRLTWAALPKGTKMPPELRQVG